MWRMAKRPGADLFLYNLASHYEIVAFSSLTSPEGSQIVEKLDPAMQLIPYRLFRDANEARDGQLYKDIGKLNRDLSKVIYMDHDARSATLHPTNTILVPKWTGNASDRELEQWIDFLEGKAMRKEEGRCVKAEALTRSTLVVSMSQTDDVRDVLKQYQATGQPILPQFDVMRRQVWKTRLAAQQRQQRSRQGTGSGFFGMFGGAGPMAPSPVAVPDDAVLFACVE